MHSHIKKLYQLSNKPYRFIIGLMSGTSLDGLDIALCKITRAGTDTQIKVVAFDTLEYDETYRQNIRQVFSKRQGDIQHLTLMNAWVGRLHGAMVNRFIQDRGLKTADIDCIASHGQTIYHSPLDHHQIADLPNATLQIGDGDHIAQTTGITTLSDFRQKHIAAGGQGAPLVMYGDYLMFSSKIENRVMLNIGGIANLTYLPKSRDINQTFSTDIGPGNTMMDSLAYTIDASQPFDKDASIASAGVINKPLLKALHTHSFFAQSFPKTTGPELFNLDYLRQAKHSAKCENLNIHDCMATLNYFSAEVICQSIQRCSATVDDISVYISGGGIHNPLLVNNIQEIIPSLSIKTTDNLGINPDAKEAVLFALLANECLAGSSQTFQNSKANLPNVSMGKISFAG
jgi:anhydro-N-acetylmuramic acid kinase